jgi:hypothetical protein
MVFDGVEGGEEHSRKDVRKRVVGVSKAEVERLYLLEEVCADFVDACSTDREVNYRLFAGRMRSIILSGHEV